MKPINLGKQVGYLVQNRIKAEAYTQIIRGQISSSVDYKVDSTVFRRVASALFKAKLKITTDLIYKRSQK